MVSSLLEFSANVDAVCEDGMTALCHAAANGHLDVIKLLCSKKANVRNYLHISTDIIQTNKISLHDLKFYFSF